ncbi:2Fe-2S iron-sulfur cluster-binding protein [Streptomyces olivoreticuli]
MSDEQQPHAQAGPVGWQPIPRGAEYDAEGTTFLQLPPELLAHPGAALSGTGTWDPLAATGAGGYTPPTGESWQQPHAPAQGQWSGQWGAHAPYEPPQPNAPADGGTHGRGADPHATAEWAMPFAAPSDAPAEPRPEPQEAQAAHPADRTAQGHWTVPAAGDDPVDESGEYVLHGRPAQHTDPHDPVAAYAVPQPPTAPGPHDSAYAPPHPAPARDTDAPGADQHAHAGTQAVGAQGQPGAQVVGAQGVDLHGSSGAQAADVPGVDPLGRSAAQAVGAQGVDPHAHSVAQGTGVPGADPHGQPESRGEGAQGADPQGQSVQHVAGVQGLDLDGQPGARGAVAQSADSHGQLGAQSAGAQGVDPHAHSAQQSAAAQGIDPHGQPAAQSAAVPNADLHGRPAPQLTATEAVASHGQPAPQGIAPQDTAPQGQSTPQDTAAAAPGVGPHGHGDPHLPADPQASAQHAPGADASGTYVLSGGTDPQGADLHGHSDSHAPAQWTPHGGSVHAWQQPVAVSLPGDGDDALVAGPTGQWSIPVVSGEPADESGEYALSGLAGATSGPSDADSTSPSGGSSQNDTGVTDTSDHQTGAWTPPAEPVAAAQEESPDDDAPPADDLAETETETEPEPPHAADIADPHTEHPCASYVLRVNGTDRPVTDAWIGESLLYVLRERLGLAGAKDGCSQGECGACSVQVDGRLVASCLVPAATAAGAEVRTVEGLAVDGRPSDVQRALAECGAVQCGFCVPGMAMTMHDLLEGNHAPSELETRQAICGNLCRCSGYRGVLDAVRQVVDERAATAAAQEEAQPETEQARIPHQAGPHGGGSGKASA